MPKGQVLTDEERERIISDRLAGVTVRQVCRKYNHSSKTVVAVFRDYCDAYGRELAEHVGATHAQQVLEAQRVADWARQEAAKYQRRVEDGKVTDEGNPAAFARLLAVELSAQRHLARLTGAESPTRVEVGGQVDVSVRVEDARRRLTEYLTSLCPSPN